MATREDLNEDLNVGMTAVRRTLEHYNLGQWNEYLVVRKPGCPDSYIVLSRPSDESDFADRLVAFHKDHTRREL
jgi:hypothetical protein